MLTSNTLNASAESLLAEYQSQPSDGSALVTADAPVTGGCETQARDGDPAWGAFLSDRIAQIRTADRRRLARDVHDKVGNGVALALRHLDLFELRQERGAAGQDLANLRRVLADVLQITRAMASDLRSPAQVDGLATALHRFAQCFQTAGTTVEVAVHGDDSLIPGEFRDELFLILGEALRNAFKHARALKVVAFVDIAPDRIVAVVRDDGIGFATGAAPRPGQGTGLMSMRERAELIGGTATVSSVVGKGTSVEITIPLPESSDAGSA